MMKMSDDGLLFLEDREGRRLTAYQDERGIWTIGVGHTGPDVKPGLVITEEHCQDLLQLDIHIVEDAINELVYVPLTQHMFDAMGSFIFNIGVEAFTKSTFLRKLNSGDYTGASNEFPRWNHAGPNISVGLTKRRLLEQFLFNS